MKKIRMAAWVALAAVCTLQGCAHDSAEKRLDEKLDEKLAQEPPIRSRADFRAETDHLIKTAPGLSADQKNRLATLLKSTRQQSDDLREKSLKLRALLIESLLSAQYDPKKVELTKTNLKVVENEKLHLFFKAVGEANTILGRAASPRQADEDDFLNKVMLDMTDVYWN